MSANRNDPSLPTALLTGFLSQEIQYRGRGRCFFQVYMDLFQESTFFFLWSTDGRRFLATCFKTRFRSWIAVGFKLNSENTINTHERLFCLVLGGEFEARYVRTCSGSSRNRKVARKHSRSFFKSAQSGSEQQPAAAAGFMFFLRRKQRKESRWDDKPNLFNLKIYYNDSSQLKVALVNNEQSKEIPQQDSHAPRTCCCYTWQQHTRLTHPHTHIKLVLSSLISLGRRVYLAELNPPDYCSTSRLHYYILPVP